MRQRRQLFVGNLVEPPDMAPILPAQLRQPHVGALGDQHRAGHPRHVRRKLLVFVHRIAERRHLRVAHKRRPLLRPSPRSRRIELRPDGQLLLAQNLRCHQQKAVERVAEQRLPELANNLQLIAERPRRAQCRRAQQIEQAHRLCARQRNQRPRGEILGHLRRHLPVNGFLGQRPVLKQLLKRLERLIAIRRPKQQQLFKRRGAVRHSRRLAGQPLRRSLLAAHHALPGKLLHKSQQHLVQVVRAHLRAKPVERRRHHLRIELLAIAGHQHVAGLVDQPHGEKLPRMNGQLGMLLARRAPGSCGAQTRGTPANWPESRCRCRKKATPRTRIVPAPSAKCGIPSSKIHLSRGPACRSAASLWCSREPKQKIHQWAECLPETVIVTSLSLELDYSSFPTGGISAAHPSRRVAMGACLPLN